VPLIRTDTNAIVSKTGEQLRERRVAYRLTSRHVTRHLACTARRRYLL